ncbi:tyrosine-protein phosphatase [Microbacterium sp. A93]|uniref:tyrosine-protein phosphatase n=1 Tax=unclassified Microbacterium TaxID=2609290 RepID=UPI003F43F2B1
MTLPAETTARLHNLRPVGGLPTSSGEWVRDDLMWRSAAPFAARAHASDLIAGLGVTCVIDLRDRGERDRTPGAWRHDDLAVREMPVFDDRLRDITFDGLPELYTYMTGDFAPSLVAAFAAIAEQAEQGVLIHCTAGKDRTGMLSAFVLDVLGVDRALILDDFAASQSHLGPEYLADLFADADVENLPGIVAHRATASPPELLADALDALECEYGSIAAFLLAHGVSQAQLESLRAVLVVQGRD